VSKVIKVASEKEAIELSLDMNREDPSALWLYGWEPGSGWFIEDWFSVNHEKEVSKA
jgi:hypothetical protein